MRNTGRVTMIRFLVLEVVVLAVTSWAQDRSPVAEQIAKTYGLDSFGQIEAIRYTFNADLGKIKVSRSWVWEPKLLRGEGRGGQTRKADVLALSARQQTRYREGRN